MVANSIIKHQFNSVEHPHAKEAWADELPQVLWAYRTTPHSTTGMEAMIPVEVEEGSPRVILYKEDTNSQAQREELNLLPEVQERVWIIEEALKHQMALRYNRKVVQRSFAANDLILI
ncbi:uncharacterized protein LOC107490472 [Arachis duranensis]|uniref:Uncharacterized protein LOC107490472 n=1 Tax=Arachis duranensis TaxID=130453 RepID=A0A6P4DE23_ARADU|nr:uncharacterized protein LOC107490472 [Arachis duranensis]